MNLLLKNIHAYAPEDCGVVDLLVVGTHIAAMGKHLDVSIPGLSVRDCEGMTAIPGLIDQHVHVTGGGGEAGPESRVPPLEISDCAEAGVTTLVGTLGTDSHTRTLRDLYAKTMALKNEGVTSWCLTGAYEYPSPALTGSVADDIVFVSSVIGCKLSISDHRCSCPSTDEIIRLASQVRLGGLISGKVGELHIHVGADPKGIAQLFEAIGKAPIPITQYRPTHMGRHLEQAEKWVSLGGYADITAGEDAVKALASLYEKLSPDAWSHVTLSSDSNGSMPKWNERREIVGMDRGRMTSLLTTISLMVGKGVPLSDVLPCCTSHVSEALKFPDAGRLEVGKRADLVLLDRFKARSVMAKGEWLSLDGVILKKGMYQM
jgi:beta-aspartyl-dipeptidase (metallo-type)